MSFFGFSSKKKETKNTTGQNLTTPKNTSGQNLTTPTNTTGQNLTTTANIENQKTSKKNCNCNKSNEQRVIKVIPINYGNKTNTSAKINNKEEKKSIIGSFGKGIGSIGKGIGSMFSSKKPNKPKENNQKINKPKENNNQKKK